jgi:hypothetical protein
LPNATSWLWDILEKKANKFAHYNLLGLGLGLCLIERALVGRKGKGRKRI